jgi:DNA-binding CsgD family transcriptional regulator/tetratricopeptide (TPR) repeat protein
MGARTFVPGVGHDGLLDRGIGDLGRRVAGLYRRLPGLYDRWMATPRLERISGALVGRELECAAIDRLLDASARGESSSLVLRGEAGIGKTALLARAAERATGNTVLRTAGVEAESDLAFAGLYGLLRPIMGKLGHLPKTQADALAGALGLAASLGSDRLLVSAATLSLLAAAAEEGPVLCLIDDAQFLDAASAEALVFGARRLAAEPVAMLFAVREGDVRTFSAPGLPELVLEGLGTELAGQLLRASAPAAADSVREWLLAEAEGNPLALLELPGGLSDAQLQGRAGLPEAIPLSSRLRSAFVQRIDRLPASTRAGLLIAAVDDTGEVGAVAGAAREAGLPADALDAAETAGLVRVVGGRIQFRHPLVRSALQGSSTISQRRAAHAALAAALTGTDDADRRAWHQALAALTADEEVAAALEASARRYQARAGHASAATAFVRAAELSADEGRRAGRLAAAAEAAWAAGQPERARELIMRALPTTTGQTRAELLYLRGVIEARTGDVRSAVAILAEAADASEHGSRTLEMLTEATEAAEWAGDYVQAAALSARAEAIEPGSETDRFRVAALSGIAAELAGDHEAATPLLREAIRCAEQLEDPLPLIWASLIATMGFMGGTFADGLPYSTRAVTIARDRGLLSILPMALWAHASALVGRGNLNLGRSAAEEGTTLASDFGHHLGAGWNLTLVAMLDAVRGDEPRARDHVEEAIELAATGGGMFVVDHAEWALGLLDLTLGRPGEATDRLLLVTAVERPEWNPLIGLWSIPDLIEAAARSGRLDETTDRFDRYASWAEYSQSAPRLSVLARCRALVGEGDTREQFEKALAPDATISPLQQARTELLFGEWLRRERQRREARQHLRRAADLFRQVGAPPWEERAAAELRATGETARRRDPSTLDQLTPQELQIAGLVAGGMTNRQIAAQLFLSPRTIDYHLRKVFSKLGVASRTELVPMGVQQHEPV